MADAIYIEDIFSGFNEGGGLRATAMRSGKPFYKSGKNVFCLTSPRPVAQFNDVRVSIEFHISELEAMKKKGAKWDVDARSWYVTLGDKIPSLAGYCLKEDRLYFSKCKTVDQKKKAISMGAYSDDKGIFVPDWYEAHWKLNEVANKLWELFPE